MAAERRPAREVARVPRSEPARAPEWDRDSEEIGTVNGLAYHYVRPVSICSAPLRTTSKRRALSTAIVRRVYG